MADQNWGGARAGAGRKKGTKLDINHRTARIVLSCTDEEAAKIKELAKQSGKNVTRFIIDAVLKQYS